MNSPIISVLMPTYNYASFLGEAIESVLAQDFADFELIIQDDCSSDATAAVAQPYCARDARVKFSVNPSNLGMVQNWNSCLAKARAPFVKILFGDDKLVQPGSLRKLLQLLQFHPTAILATSARLILDGHSKVTDLWRTLPDGCHPGRNVIDACLIENGNLIGEPSSVMVRKQDLGAGFDPSYRQIVDVAMWFDLLQRGDLAYTREPLCAYRLHERQQSAVNDNLGLAWQEHLRFFSAFATRPWISPRAKFSALFALRRMRRKKPGQVPDDLTEVEKTLEQQVGKARYTFSLLYYKAAHPWQNFSRSLDKTQRRRDLVQSTFSTSVLD